MKILIIALLATLSFGVFANDTFYSNGQDISKQLTDQQTTQLMQKSFDDLRTLYIVYYTTGQNYEKYGEQSYAFRDAAAIMATFFADPSLIDVYVEKIKSGDYAETGDFSAQNLIRGVVFAVFNWKF